MEEAKTEAPPASGTGGDHLPAKAFNVVVLAGGAVLLGFIAGRARGVAEQAGAAIPAWSVWAYRTPLVGYVAAGIAVSLVYLTLERGSLGNPARNPGLLLFRFLVFLAYGACGLAIAAPVVGLLFGR